MTPILADTAAYRLTEAAIEAGKSPQVILSLYRRLREWELCDQETAEARCRRVIWAGLNDE